MSANGLVPEYVPQHLRGKVSDFRKEDDGSVSFAHPEAGLGLGPEMSRVNMDEGQYKNTFDKQHRLGNFEEAMKSQYAPLQRRPKTSGEELNEGIANFLRRGYNWGTSSQGKAVGTAGLLAALAGGVGSYMMGSSKKKALLLSLLAGGLGAGGTALMQRNYNQRAARLDKQASSADSMTMELIEALRADSQLTGYERQQLLRAITQLSNNDQSKLYDLVKTGLGAGAGMLVMRFLGAKGLLPMIAGGIVGGMVGSRNPKLKRNGQGQVSITNYL